ncbi:MAG: cyclic nucleotide-binding protein [Gammaproteobacteria bacterium]
MDFHDLVGIIGVILILAAYLLLQIGTVTVQSLWYSLANAIGAVLILFSLYFDFNLPSVIIELAWLAISLIGITRAFFDRSRTFAKRSS